MPLLSDFDNPEAMEKNQDVIRKFFEDQEPLGSEFQKVLFSNLFNLYVESKKIPEWKWTIHNCVGHPLMQIFRLFGLYSLADKIDYLTIPKEQRGI